MGPQIEHFVELGWHAIAPNLCGFGEVEVTAGIVYSGEVRRRRRGPARSAGHTSAVVLGYCMGGQVAREIHYSCPQRVRALVNVDIVEQGEDAAGKRRPNVVPDRLLTQGMHDVASGLLAPMIAGYKAQGLTGVADKVLGMSRASPAVGSAATQRGRAQHRDFTAALASFTVPALVVVGADDAFDDGAAARMHELMPHSTPALIEGAGHTPSKERPARFNVVLQEFLTGI